MASKAQWQKERAEKVKTALARIKTGVANLQSSEAWKAFLKAQGRFHNYSVGNVLLILAQRPEARRVAGYKTWQSLGRQVRKGEQGIAILAPCPWSRTRTNPATGEEEEEHGLNFRVVYVFDLAQTDGEPLPSLPGRRLETAEAVDARDRLMAYAQELGYTVELAAIPGEARVDLAAYRIELIEAHAPDHHVTGLTHELAHIVLKHGERRELSRQAKELEAESVGYAVATALGVDESSFTFAYLATYLGQEEIETQMRALADLVQAAARQILDGVESQEPASAPALAAAA